LSTLQEWLAAQREQLAQDRTEVVPVPGYEERLAGRYRLLPLARAEKIVERAKSNLDRYADTIINSCIELLEITGENEYQSTGHTWNRDGVRELFGVDLPDNATSRQAVFAAFPPPMGEYKLYQHFVQIDEKLSAGAAAADEVIEGNSEAGSAEAEPSISQ